MTTRATGDKTTHASTEPSTRARRPALPRRPRTVLIVNPYSSGLTASRERKLVHHLREFLELDVQRTQRPGHASALGAEALERGADVVIAAGGDGTANEIVNGWPVAHGSADELPLFCHLPAGATNVVARSLGLPNDPVRATRPLLTAILGGKYRTINLGTIDERSFVFAAGVGFDGALVKAKETKRSGRRASDLAYMASAFGYLAAERWIVPDRLRVTIEGGETFSASIVICANNDPYTFVGRLPVRLMPQARWEEGLDLIAPTRLNPARLVRFGVKSIGLGRRPGSSDGVLRLHHDVDSFVVESDDPQPCQCDGEYIGDRTHMRFGVLRNALRLVG